MTCAANVAAIKHLFMPPAEAERGIAVSAADPMVLFEALRPAVNLAIWHRPVHAGFNASLATLMTHAPFCLTAEDMPEAAVDAIALALPAPAPAELR